MSETAALLVDHLLPAVPYRHITLTFAGPLAVRMGYEKSLLARVLLGMIQESGRQDRHWDATLRPHLVNRP